MVCVFNLGLFNARNSVPPYLHELHFMQYYSMILIASIIITIYQLVL